MSKQLRCSSSRLSGMTESYRGNIREQSSLSRDILSSSLHNLSLSSDNESSPLCKNETPIQQNETNSNCHNNQQKNKKRKFTFVSNERGLHHFHIVDEDNFRIKYYAQRNILHLRNTSDKLRQTRKSKMLTLNNRAPLLAEDVWMNRRETFLDTPLPISPHPESDSGIFGDLFEQ